MMGRYKRGVTMLSPNRSLGAFSACDLAMGWGPTAVLALEFVGMAAYGRDMISVVALVSALVVLVTLVSPLSECLCIVFMLVPYYQLLKIGGTEAETLLMLVLALKMVLSNWHISKQGLISGCVIAGYELAHLVALQAGFDSSVLKWTICLFLVLQLLAVYPGSFSVSKAVLLYGLSVAIFSFWAVVGNAGAEIDATTRQYLKYVDTLDQNTFGLYCLSAVVLLVNLAMRVRESRTKAVAAITSAVCFVGGMLVLSKAYLLVFIVSIFFYLLVLCKKPMALICYMAFLLVAAAVLLNIPTVSNVVNSYVERLLLEGGSLSAFTTGRSDLLREYIEYLFDPAHVLVLLFGAGLNTYFPLFGIVMRPHNSVIELISAWGLVGVVLFVGLILWTTCSGSYFASERSKPASHWIPLIAVLIMMQSLTLFYQYVTLFLLLLLTYELLGQPEARTREAYSDED